MTRLPEPPIGSAQNAGNRWSRIDKGLTYLGVCAQRKKKQNKQLPTIKDNRPGIHGQRVKQVCRGNANRFPAVERRRAPVGLTRPKKMVITARGLLRIGAPGCMEHNNRGRLISMCISWCVVPGYSGEFRGADDSFKDIIFYLYEKYPLLGIKRWRKTVQCFTVPYTCHRTIMEGRLT